MAVMGEVQQLDISSAAPISGSAVRLSESVILKPNTCVTFNAIIGATILGNKAAVWEFNGIVRRGISPSSIKLLGVNAVKVVADDDTFADTYIDIDVDRILGALEVRSYSASHQNIHWDADIQIKQVQ